MRPPVRGWPREIRSAPGLSDTTRAKIESTALRMVEEPLPVDDPTQRQPDITLARERLGWEPTVDLREGLTRTAEYFTRKLGL